MIRVEPKTTQLVLVREKYTDRNSRESFTFEFESKEKALECLERAKNEAEKETGFFMFMGRSFVSSSNFWYGIYLLEEWFEEEKLINTKVLRKDSV